MKKQIFNYILIGIVGLLLFPTISNASTLPQNSKKELNGKTYTSVFKTYTLPDEYINPDPSIPYLMYGIIPPKKIIAFSMSPEGIEYFAFENGNFRDTNVTDAELFETRKKTWNGGEEKYYLDRYIDEEGNEKSAIFYSDSLAFEDRSNNSCYVMNSDPTAVEGKEYYTFGPLEEVPTLVSNFNAEEAIDYYVKVNCDQYSQALIKTLTSEESALIESLIESQIERVKTEYEIDDDFIYVSTRFLKTKDKFNIINKINYKKDEDSEYETINIIYDFSGNKLIEVEGSGGFHYLENLDIIFIASSTYFRVYDAHYNVIYSELKSNLPVESDYGNYAGGCIYDANSVYFDFINGVYMVLTRYVVEEGDNQKFLDKDLTIKFNGELELLEQVMVNDSVLDAKHYTKTEGSTIITLSKDYLSSLNNGTYTLKVSYKDGGAASSTFIIDKPVVNPATGDNIIKVIIMGSISLIGLIGSGLYKKKVKYY